jgi:hypothetical protein
VSSDILSLNPSHLVGDRRLLYNLYGELRSNPLTHTTVNTSILNTLPDNGVLVTPDVNTLRELENAYRPELYTETTTLTNINVDNRPTNRL